MSRALFGMSFLDSLLRYCLAHCFVCVLSTVCHVSALHTVLNVFCLMFCDVHVLRSVLNVFYRIVCHVRSSHKVLYVFC